MMPYMSSLIKDHPGIRVGIGKESYIYRPKGLPYKVGTEVVDTRDLRSVSIPKMEQPSMAFDPKAFDTVDWCPVYCIGKTESGGNVYFCSINDNIDLIHEYAGLLDVLYDATDKDVLELNISSPGGYISTATQICTAINSCRGCVMTHASGLCASAGSLLWSVGHEVSVGDTALFMWHMSSHYDNGNSLAIREEADFQVNYVRDTLLSISLKRGFITEKEVEEICTNPDESKWISATEMRERINQRAAMNGDYNE